MAKKPKRPTGRGSDQFIIRFPEGMRDRVAKLAAGNNRSMNAELIDRLEKSMADQTVEMKKLLETYDRMDSRLETIKQILEERGVIRKVE